MSTCVTVALFLYLPLKFLCFFLENFQIELQFVLLNLFCGFLMFFLPLESLYFWRFVACGPSSAA